MSTGIFTDYVVFELERFFNKEVFKILGDALSKSSRIKIEEEIHYIFESLVRKFQLEQVLYNYNGYTLREVSLRKSFIIDLKDVASLVGEYMLGSLKHGVWLKDHLEVWMPHALDTITNKSQEFKVAHDLLVNGELEHLRSLFKDDASKLDQFNRIASEAILKTDDSIGILRSKTMDTAENFFRVLNAELFKSASNPKVNLIEARSQINAFHKLFLDNSSSWVAREYVAVNNETKNLVSYLAQIASDIYHKD